MAETTGPAKPAPAPAPGCDEFSGGGGSATDTRDRALPGHKEGDCDPIGELRPDPQAPSGPTDTPRPPP